MRFSKVKLGGVKLAGLAAALVGAAADEASANDVTVSTATTNPLLTSAPDGASPGDVTITAAGSVAVTTGQTAVTVDSNNDVSNAGALSSNDANNSTGILLQGGFAGPQVITNSGTISLLENYTLADTDNDGDLDGTFAAPTSTNRHGIRLGAGAAFNGDIANTGAISMEGNNSAAIRLDARLNGNLTSSSPVSVVGDNSTAFAILGGGPAGVTGNVFLRGNLTAQGTGVRGLAVEAPIGGQLRVNGSWSVTGYHNTLRTGSTTLDADDLQQSGAAVDIRSSIAGGVTIEGIGVEDDLDDDGDGIAENATTPDANDDLTATVNVFGGAPAIHVRADPGSNIALGPTASTYGLHVRGNVGAFGVFDGFDATAIRIEGSATSTATTAAGIALDGPITATAVEADSYGLYLGVGASAPTTLVRREVTSSVISETAGDDAFGIFIAAGANASALNNSGTLTARLFGEAGNAAAITDLSNTLATITNSGTIVATVTATDANLTDNIPPPAITGTATAIDVSASSIGVTLNQIADTPFTDDDTVDNDSASRPAVSIQGAIRMGSGADAVNLLAGAIAGDLSFGAGADALTINNGATYTGVLSDSDGALTLNVVNGTLALQGQATNITSATFGASSVFTPLLSATPSQSTHLISSGDITFLAGARVAPIAPAGLPVSGTHTFLTAGGSLIGAANVTGPITGANTPFLYNFQVDQASNSLVANYTLKTAPQLGLTTNQAIAYDPMIAALRGNANAAAALAGLNGAAAFADAYGDLMPSYAAASTELAATGIQQAQSATSNRLAATRLHGLNEVSVWAQEIGYALTRTPATPNGQKYDGAGFGMALGIDGPLNNGALFGLSLSLLASEATEDGRPDGELASTFGQANAYLGAALGPIDLDFIAGLGAGQLQSRRFVEIGNAFNARSDAKWWAYEGHAAMRASAPMRLADWLVVTPQAAVTYVSITEEGYTEKGGGVGIDYDADQTTSQRVWGDAGLEISGRFRMGVNTVLAPRLYGGYRSSLMDAPAERSFRFASGGADFILTDEPVGDGAPLAGIGIDASNGYSTLSLSYEGELGDQIERHSLNAAMRFRF